MKRSHSTALHKWPRNGKQQPGPRKKYTHIAAPPRVNEDHIAMLKALQCEFGISEAEVWRRGLQLLYERTYHERDFNRNKLFDGYADV